MSRVRRVSTFTGIIVLTIAVAYVLGVQAGSFINERKRAERRAKGVEHTRSILDRMQTIEVGDRLPDVPMEDIDGYPHLLSELVQGQALITYTQTSCDACLMELERIAELCRNPSDYRRFIFVSTANPLHLMELRSNFGLESDFLFDEERVFGNALHI